MNLETLVSLVKTRVDTSQRAVVAFSGGVDSGLAALSAYRALGDNSTAVTVVSELTPEREKSQAVLVAERIGINHRIIPISVLNNEQVRCNAPDRCYHCKRILFQTLLAHFGNNVLMIDGTNAADDPARPGLKAVKEYGVFSPLYEAGLTKEDVRIMARQAGLPNADAPSESCLATRIQVGAPLSQKGLRQVEAMETLCHEMGVDTLRVKHDNLVAIVEYLPQYSDIMELNRDKIVAMAHSLGFRSCEFKEWMG